MYGYDKSYSELLSLSGLKSLEERRNVAILKFAKKTSENVNYSNMFPLKENDRNLRKNEVFLEEFAHTERFYKSPIFTYRRLLNGNFSTLDYLNPNHIDLDHVFNDPFD